MTTSHEAAEALARALSGNADLTQDEIGQFYLQTLPAFSELKRELISDWILASVEEIRPEDVTALVDRLDACP